MNKLILNADYFTLMADDTYYITSQGKNYFLDEDKNILIQQDTLIITFITEQEKSYIIEKCLEDMPF